MDIFLYKATVSEPHLGVMLIFSGFVRKGRNKGHGEGLKSLVKNLPSES